MKTAVKAPLAALVAAAAVLIPATSAQAAGDTKVGFSKDRMVAGRAILSFSGRLTWDGAGGYTVQGDLKADCSNDEKRTTVWLQYGGDSESWKDSSETECKYGNENSRAINISGKLKPGEKLELRLGTWQEAAVWIGSTAYTDKKTYDISS